MTKDEIKRLYESGETQTIIGKRYGVSSAAISKFMRKHGIPARNIYSRKRKDIDVQRLAFLYLSGLSYDAVGRKVGLSSTLVRSRLLENGYQSRIPTHDKRCINNRL